MGEISNILVLLSELSIAFISVSIANFVLGLPYLKRLISKQESQLRHSEHELRDRSETNEANNDFNRNISDLLEQQEAKEKTLKKYKNNLSLKKALIIPCTLFTSSLVFSILFLYYGDYVQTHPFINLLNFNISTDLVFILVPSILLIGGIYYPLRTLQIVETIELSHDGELTRPVLKIIGFPERFQVNEEKEFRLKLRNIGDVIANNILVFIYFPEGFIVMTAPRTNISRGTRPGSHVVSFRRERLAIKVTRDLGKIKVKTPSSSGTHEVWVTYREDSLLYEKDIFEINVQD